MPIPQYFTPRWIVDVQPFLNGWTNLSRGGGTGAALLSAASVAAALSNPANNPTNLPPGATFFGAQLPNGSYSGLGSNSLAPNQRLVGFQVCMCQSHIPGSPAGGHQYGIAYYVVTDPPINPPDGNIPDLTPDPPWDKVEPDGDISLEEDTSGDPCIGRQPKDITRLNVVLFVLSSIINLSANLTRRRALWGSLFYGSAGNMLGNPLSSYLSNAYIERGIHAPTAAIFHGTKYNFSEWQEPMGIRDLPCFQWSPLPKYDEVVIDTSFIAWAKLDLQVYRGFATTGLPVEFMDSLAKAILGLDVRGASGLDDYNEYRANYEYWQAQIRQIAENNGYEIVPASRDRIDLMTGEIDPNKHTILSFYSAFRVSLSLPVAPSRPADGFAMMSSPLYEHLQRLYDVTYPNNAIDFHDGFSYTKSMKMWNHGILGINFIDVNPVIKFEKDGNWYRYIMADSSRLSVKGELTEAIINSCYADHPAKDNLLQLVKYCPMKFVFPEFTHPLNNKTNPVPCWGITNPKPQYFKTAAPFSSGLGTAQLGLGETIDTRSYIIYKEFEAKLDVPGHLENGHVLTYNTKPLVLIPNSYYSGLLGAGLNQFNITDLLNNPLDTLSAAAGIVSNFFPPAGAVSTIIEAAKLLQSIINLGNNDLTKHQAHNGFIFQEGLEGHPSKFRVCRTEPTLPTPTNNTIRVLDSPNDKTQSPPIDQEVQVIKLPSGQGLGGFPDV